jgi:hypothetical protein
MILERFKHAFRQRARTSARPAMEIGASFSVLALIMISALAVRFLLSLSNGVAQ